MSFKQSPPTLGNQFHEDRVLLSYLNRVIPPGVLGEINSQLSGRGVNILGQYLKTNDRVGYVILDVDTTISKEAVSILREAKETLKTRVVY